MALYPDYTTVDDLAAYLRIEDDIDDVLLAQWITAASRAVDGWAHRQFGRAGTATSMQFGRDAMWCDASGYWNVAIFDLVDATGLTVNGTAWASVGGTLKPLNAPVAGRPYTVARFAADPRDSTTGLVTLTSADWGWSAVPGAVVQATQMTAARFSKLRSGPLGVVGSPNGDGETKLLSTLDPTVRRLLFSFQRHRRGA